MAMEFSNSVSYGLKLSKRIYYGKDMPAPPVEVPSMTRSASSVSASPSEKEVVVETALYMPTAPMVYAVVPDPEVVDNPDIPSYQPYVYGRCVPPALIPLNMHGVAMEIESVLDTAFVAVSGTWRVHCVMAGQRCDCRIAVPMGEQVKQKKKKKQKSLLFFFFKKKQTCVHKEERTSSSWVVVLNA